MPPDPAIDQLADALAWGALEPLIVSVPAATAANMEGRRDE